MAQTLFVSEQYIKDFTPVGPLVEWNEIEPSLHLAQDSFIQDMLGTNFYVYLQAQFEAQVLTADEIELVARIKPALAHRVAEQAIPFINWQIKNKGIMTQRGDYADPASLESIKYLRNELANRAEFYSVRLTKWLCDNRALFPQYEFNNTTDMKPTRGEYSGCDLWFY